MKIALVHWWRDCGMEGIPSLLDPRSSTIHSTISARLDCKVPQERYGNASTRPTAYEDDSRCSGGRGGRSEAVRLATE